MGQWRSSWHASSRTKCAFLIRLKSQTSLFLCHNDKFAWYSGSDYLWHGRIWIFYIGTFFFFIMNPTHRFTNEAPGQQPSSNNNHLYADEALMQCDALTAHLFPSSAALRMHGSGIALFIGLSCFPTQFKLHFGHVPRLNIWSVANQPIIKLTAT